jgi:putative ABC transport system permease protein
MRTLWDIFGQTIRTLWAHKLRSFLTMFGIAWGVFSLLLLVGLGEGFRSGNKKQLAQIGENIMFLFGGRVPAAEGSHTASHTFQVTYADYLAIKQDAKLVGEVAPVLNRGDIRVIYDSQSTNGQVFGVTGNYNKIRYMPIDQGRWLHDADDTDRHYVAILGNEMFKNLFGKNSDARDAIGKTVLLNGYRFTVIGTVKKMRGESSATDMRVFIPFSVMQKHFPLKDAEKDDSITYINYQPREVGLHDAALHEVRTIVGKNHGDIDPSVDDYWFDWDTIEQQKTIGKIWDAMNSFLGGVGLITLVLGAIGVINIMLVAVAERTKEIGLRKALGATNRSILTQFFIEGAFLTTLSGSIGILLAWGLMAALGTLPAPEGFDPPTLVPSSAMIALLSLSLAGIIAGLYPARKAALLTPTEALRNE